MSGGVRRVMGAHRPPVEVGGMGVRDQRFEPSGGKGSRMDRSSESCASK